MTGNLFIILLIFCNLIITGTQPKMKERKKCKKGGRHGANRVLIKGEG